LGLLNTTARYLVADDYPIGFDPAFVDLGIDFIKTNWATKAMAEFLYGPIAQDSEFVNAWTRQVRVSMTPRSAAAQWRHIVETVDARDALGLIRTPTIVMHHRDDPNIPLSHGQYLAAHIPGARFVEWPGMSDYENMGEVAEELGVFLTGERHGFEVDRILTTVLFTDIVGSTERAASIGGSAVAPSLGLPRLGDSQCAS
jgi:pimeloyl-ACP methyl ester carboxylesterase